MARNITEMLELHGRLLSDIARALPCTTQMIQDHSLDASLNTGDMARYPILADPAAAAVVARAFDTAVGILSINNSRIIQLIYCR
jgi:hypothetical protein